MSLGFHQRKQQILQDLQLGSNDFSPKGSLDTPIIDLVDLLNRSPDYVTTSSCSGRIAVYQKVKHVVDHLRNNHNGTNEINIGDLRIKDDDPNKSKYSNLMSQNKWLLCEHRTISVDEVRKIFDEFSSLEGKEQQSGSRFEIFRNCIITLRQEPFILHVECRTIQSAELLVNLGRSVGFRESGILINSGTKSYKSNKIIAAIRTCTSIMEVPLYINGMQIVHTQGLGPLVTLANEKFEENLRRIEAFQKQIKDNITIEDSEDKNIEKISNLIEKREQNNLLKRQREIFVFPKIDHSAHSKLEYEDLENNLDIAPVVTDLAIKRIRHTSCVHQNMIYIFGGYGKDFCKRENEKLNDVVVLSESLDNNTASRGSLILRHHIVDDKTGQLYPCPREAHAAVVLSQEDLKGKAPTADEGNLTHDSRELTLCPQMLVYGGKTNEGIALDDCWVFNIDSLCWSRCLRKESYSSPTKIYPRWGHTLCKLSSASIRKIFSAVNTELPGLLFIGGVGNKIGEKEIDTLNQTDNGTQIWTANSVTFIVMTFDTSFVDESGLVTAYEVHEWVVDIAPEIKSHTCLNSLYYHHSVRIPSREDPTEENILIFGGLIHESTESHDYGIMCNSDIFMILTSSSTVQTCRIGFETQTSSHGANNKKAINDYSMEDLSPFMYNRFGTACSVLSDGKVLIVGGIHSFRGNPFSSNYIGMDLLEVHAEKRSKQELPPVKVLIRRIDTNRIFYYGSPLVHHTLAILPTLQNSIYLIGGGVVCGGFETLYCTTKRLFLQDSKEEIEEELVHKSLSESFKNSLQRDPIQVKQDKAVSFTRPLCILIPKESVKVVKTTLEKLKLYDKSYNISSLENITIPDITKQEILQAFKCVNDREDITQNLPTHTLSPAYIQEEVKKLCLYALPILPDKEKCFRDICNNVDHTLDEEKEETVGRDIIFKSKFHVSRLALPASKLAKSSLSRAVTGLLNNIVQQLGISITDNQYFPKKLEMLGEDVLLIQPDDFQGQWSTSYHILFPELAKIHKVSRIARSSRIKSNGIRESTVELLFVDNMKLKSYWQEIFSKVKSFATSDFLPVEIVNITNNLATSESRLADDESPAIDDNYKGWIRVRENGIHYYFNFLTCMFSSGNVTEKKRYSNFNCDGEIVIDLYAGIGYYTLPLLIHGKAKFLYACEWNPEAIKALKFNLVINNIAGNRYKILEGDNRITTKYNPSSQNNSTFTSLSLEENIDNSADRISLGLLPSSKAGLSTATRLLKRTGGWMHVHENVNEHYIQDFAKTLVEEISFIAKHAFEKDWHVECHHIEKVKSYAPRVIHVVFDIFCREKRIESDEGEN